MLLLALMRRVFRVFHLVAEFQQGIFDIVKALWRGFAIAGGAYRRHIGKRDFSLLSSIFFRSKEKRREEEFLLKVNQYASSQARNELDHRLSFPKATVA